MCPYVHHACACLAMCGPAHCRPSRACLGLAHGPHACPCLALLGGLPWPCMGVPIWSPMQLPETARRGAGDCPMNRCSHGDCSRCPIIRNTYLTIMGQYGSIETRGLTMHAIKNADGTLTAFALQSGHFEQSNFRRGDAMLAISIWHDANGYNVQSRQYGALKSRSLQTFTSLADARAAYMIECAAA